MSSTGCRREGSSRGSSTSSRPRTTGRPTWTRCSATSATATPSALRSRAATRSSISQRSQTSTRSRRIPPWPTGSTSAARRSLLDGARELEIGRFVYASTIWVYGDAAGPEAVDEDTPLGLPKHFYTATKIAGEMYTSAYTELYGLEHTILRFGIPYGPRSRPTAVVAAFTAKALAGQPLTIAGDGTQSRRFVYVEDLADGVAAALVPAAANRVYNLVGRENTSVRSIARTVRDVVGDVPIVHIEGRAGDLKGGNISGERAPAELGWEPTTPFAEGVRRYVDWVTDEAGMPRVATASSTDGSAAAVLRQESAEL